MTNTQQNGKRFWVLGILLAVVLAAVFSFAFVFTLPVYAEEEVKEIGKIERLEDLKSEILDINVVRSYPAEPSSTKSLRSSFSTYSYIRIFVKSAAIDSPYESDRTFTISNQTGLTRINWGDGTATNVSSGDTTLSHVYTARGSYDVMLEGVTSFGYDRLCTPDYSYISVSDILISSDLVSIHPNALTALHNLNFFVSEDNPNFCTENYNSFPEGSSSRSGGYFLLSKSGKDLIRCGFDINYTVNIPYGIDCLRDSSCQGYYYYNNPTRYLIIPDTVTSIQYNSIFLLQNLKDIVIGSGLESIGLQGIYNCSALENVIIKATVPPSLGSNVFTYCNDCNFYVPAESVDTYKADSSWESFSERIFAMTEEMEEEYYTGDPALLVEPTTPDEPNTEPSDSTETNTDEKKPFDFGEWIYGAGENVSAWLGENIGIATTGSTVLIIGAVIIAVILLKKRR